MKKITKDEFIRRSNEKHGYRYDYRLVNPIKNSEKIKIIDKKTGLIYIQSLRHHKDGRKPTKIESNSLVKKFKEIHSDKFDYLIEGKTYNSTDRIKMINKKTGDVFYYLIYRHLAGMCPNSVTLNYFLVKSKEVHGEKYDYSLVKKISSNRDNVLIICPEHGQFRQSVSNHMNLGDGCPKCAGVGKWNTELLVSEFKKVHCCKFDYSLVKFENIDKVVEIICQKHGTFSQNIHKHLNGQGCKFCESKSKGEDYVSMWLEYMGIKYHRQKTFVGCRHKNPLFFDFYLPEYNTCVEFDGEQHYRPIDRFGGEIEFENRKIRDGIKNSWCFDNGINLIRIGYNEVSKIKYILEEKLK